MINTPQTNTIIQNVSSFEKLMAAPFQGQINAISWIRKLEGDFEEIINALECDENRSTVHPQKLMQLQLTEQGQLAPAIILNDLKMLEEQRAAPTLNVIHNYERDENYPFFPTDVYSFHVDRSPLPTSTILCTCFSASSDLIPNEEVTQKIKIPANCAELLKFYDGEEGQGFEDFLTEYFFDLHYQPIPNAQTRSLSIGHIWKLAINHPESTVLPRIHRAPIENKGENVYYLFVNAN